MSMAGQLAPHLSHKSALALLPPAVIAPPIEAVRRVHDKHFARWPPHINLIYPFLASPSELEPVVQQGDGTQVTASPGLKEDTLRRAQNAIKEIKSFHITLSADPPGTFSHSKRSKTVWLSPLSETIRHLQAELQTEFSECNADNRPFTPHLSIGQAQSDNGARKLGEEIKEEISKHNMERSDGAVALDWEVDKVFVIERKGFHGRFKVVGTIELDKN